MMNSSSWRRFGVGSAKHQSRKHHDDLSIIKSDGGITTPPHFRCPISLDLMKDPVTLSTGITYDRLSIETWFDNGNTTCPVTNQYLTVTASIPNHTIRILIQEWCVQNRSFGIDRIPTPRIPLTSSDASQIINKLILGYQRRDGHECLGLVGKIRTLSKESERNKRCFLSTQVRPVLAAVFETFATDENGVALLEDVLSALTSLPPLAGAGAGAGAADAIAHLTSQASVRRIVKLLTCAHLSTRTNAVLILKDVLSHDHQAKIESFVSIEGASKALLQLIKEPICPAATKASLTIIFYIASASNKNKTVLVDMGLVPVIIEGLVEFDKSTSEKALAVLDALCSTPKGKEDICNHELSIPVLVKKLFRVSDLATEFSVSVIWKLCKIDKGNEEVLFEALQVGAFQKLLLLLQVGCAERTKEKATEVLKMLNTCRNKLRAC